VGLRALGRRLNTACISACSCQRKKDGKNERKEEKKKERKEGKKKERKKERNVTDLINALPDNSSEKSPIYAEFFSMCYTPKD
jgi:ribosomal protein L12E/L44/L45/RPP1/RPP2